MSNALAHPFPAVLLLGPTGAGKSPLGDWLQAHGLWGRRCHHFDFGANLRAVVSGPASGRFNHEEIRHLRAVLEQGALLEDNTFYLAAKILEYFLAQRRVAMDHLLVLNGLPRHVGQARAMERWVRVMTLIRLECDAATIGERLLRNTGGDRAGRADDSKELVARKLATFEARTRPLVDYYQQAGTRVILVKVGVETQPVEIVKQVEQQGGQF